MAFIETEEKLIIETPERVELEFALASIGNRFLAALIDHLVHFLAILSVYYFSVVFADRLSDLFENEELSKWTTALGIVLVFIIYFGYFAVFEWLWNGQTPGKRLMKLRVIREDGRPIGFWEAFIRNLLRIVDAFPGVYSVGLITVFLSGRDQRIGDLFAGTVVVRERADEAPSLDDVLSSNLEDETLIRSAKPVNFQADLSLLKPEEIAVVRAFLQRRLDLDVSQRLWLAWRIALPIMYKLKPRYSPENFTYEGFLEELFHRYNQMKKI